MVGSEYSYTYLGYFPMLGTNDKYVGVVQGDHSTCSKPPVDFKTKVPFWPGQDRPKRNFSFEVNGRFVTT